MNKSDMRKVRFDRPVSVTEALTEARMLWEPKDAVLGVHFPDGTHAGVPTHKALVRSDSGAQLGIVGADYTSLTQPQAFAPVQALCETGELTIHEAFEAKGGSVVGLRCVIGQPVAREVGGLYPEATFTNTHDGSASWSCVYQLKRLVCLNGMTRVVRSKAWRAVHRTNVVANVAAMQLEFTEQRRVAEDAAALFQSLLQRKLDEKNLRRYVREVLGPDGAANNPDVTVRHVDEVMGFAETAPGAQPGTLYGGLNAVTYFATHERGRSDSAREVATLFGNGSALIERATAKAVAYADKLPLIELGRMSYDNSATAAAEFAALLAKR